MSELPVGWINAEIGKLCILINGRAFKPQDWEKEGLPIIRIQNLNRSDASFNYFNGELDPRHLVNPGQLLFAWSGTPGTSFGAHVWKGKQAALNQHIFKIDFDESEINKTFFRHAINQKLDELIASAQGGVGLRHVTKGTFERTPIALPPLAEQKRIVQKLDALLAQVDALKARIDAIPMLLKRFRGAVLKAAVAGDLTQKWRSNRQQIKESTWENTTFSAICREITVGYVGKMLDQYRPSGVPFLRSQNVRPFQFSPKNLLYISEEFNATLSKSRLEPGDLAIVRSGAPGVTCVIPESLVMANCSDLVIARPSTKLNSSFGCIFMNSETGQRSVSENQVGVAQQHFNVGSMKRLKIQLPPIEEQAAIADQVELLFTLADQLEAKVSAAQQRINTLTQSLLAKAFRGELVPQDPNDEPASALLERISAQHAAAPKPKRGRKSSATT